MRRQRREGATGKTTPCGDSPHPAGTDRRLVVPEGEGDLDAAACKGSQREVFMSLCPRCQQRLARTPTPQGVVFVCPKCKGRAAGLAVLRRSMNAKILHVLWLQAHDETAKPGADCPICERPMVEAIVPHQPQPATVNVCTGCQFVWFDANEFEECAAHPSDMGEAGADPRTELSEEAREKLALLELQSDQMRQTRHERYEQRGVLGSGLPWRAPGCGACPRRSAAV